MCPTNEVLSTAVTNSMQNPNQPTGIPDSLLIPYHRLMWALSLILLVISVFLYSESLVGLADRENQKESAGRAGYEGEKFGVVDTENIMERER